jgi:hypothetical protein
MNFLLATLARRAIEIRRVARHVLLEAASDLSRQAPYLTSVGSVVGIATVIAISKLFPAGAWTAQRSVRYDAMKSANSRRRQRCRAKR